MKEVYLSLGSNVGDRQKFISDAITRLRAEISAIKTSSLYKTEPWGNTDQPEFLNICVKGNTALSARRLLDFIKDIESKLGRSHSDKWGPREIDIDILFYEDQVVHEHGLDIPHPHLAQRAFVLIPLAEIAPGFMHPVLHKTIKQLSENISVAGVKKVAHE